MRRSRIALPALALLGLFLSLSPAIADAIAPARPPVDVTVEDFGYLDTSQEPVDQTSVHQARVQTLMTALRKDIATDPRYRLASDTAQPASARIKIVGGIHKMSTLVQWARVKILDVTDNRMLLDRLYTFRGDSQDAWDHAEAFLSDEIRSSLAALPVSPAVAEKPIALALFDFELEDASAAAAHATE